MKEPVKKYVAIAWIVILGAFLAYALVEYISAFFGAIVFFALFQPLYLFFRRKRLRPGFAAGLVIIVSLLIVIVPSAFLIKLLVGEISNISASYDSLIASSDKLDALYPGTKALLTGAVGDLTGFLKSELVKVVQGAAHAMVTITIMYFLLFYLFINLNDIKRIAMRLIPFKKKNALLLYQEFQNVTHSTIVATGLIALLQGSLFGLGLFVLGIKGALLWGFVGVVFSFLPVVGMTVLWIPASAFQLAQGHYVTGTILFGLGTFISTIDNFVRPYIQKRGGSIHPLTSIIGIFIGLPYFGLVGIVVGPLLLSYFLLTIRIFRREYL
jgi:predicted PurR-regulated permease PerM